MSLSMFSFLYIGNKIISIFKEQEKKVFVLTNAILEMFSILRNLENKYLVEEIMGQL